MRLSYSEKNHNTIAKQIACLSELHQPGFTQCMKDINQIAHTSGLQEYTTYSRIWEYPWLWSRLKSLKDKKLRVLDIGSEKSPFPWFLACKGFDVIVSDLTPNYWGIWQYANRQIKRSVDKYVLDAQNLDLPTGSIDVYLSVSVIEHVVNKEKAIKEAARVLRPGGLLIMTFDICEPEMGMTFPEWNGRALTMSEFDKLFKNSPWFEPGLSELPWNKRDIPDYLAWHRTTAAHHNYVTGAAVVRRNNRIWIESEWKDRLRSLRGKSRKILSVIKFYLLYSLRAIQRKLVRQIKSTAQKGLSLLTSPHATFFFCEPFFWLLGRRGSRRQIDLLQVKRVLIVRLDEIGDVVMTTPFLRELRRNLREAWITLIVKPAVYNLMELCPYVNEVLTYDWNTNGRLGQLQQHGRALGMAWKRLWQRRFDLAIVPRWDADYYHGTFVSYFSGAPWRVGYSENVSTEKKRLNNGFDLLFTHLVNDSSLKHEVECNRGFDMLFTHVLKDSKGEHEVEHNLNIIRALGGTVENENLEAWASEKDKTFAKDLLSSQGVARDDILIAFGPGKRDPKRVWPVERFVELGVWLRNEYNAFIVVIGGKEDREAGNGLKSELGERVINSVGQTNLRQACALLAECQLFVGNDSGPMHMAAAAGLKIVEICGHPITGSALHKNSPVRFGPWGVPHIVIQPKKAIGPCFDVCIAKRPHCILGITVNQVKEAVRSFLS